MVMPMRPQAGLVQLQATHQRSHCLVAANGRVANNHHHSNTQKCHHICITALSHSRNRPSQLQSRLVAAAGGSQDASSRAARTASKKQAAWRVPLDEPWTALLLAWFASRGRSLLAAQCLVEAALQLYLSGVSFSEVQMGIKLANLTSSQQSPGQQAQLTPGDDDEQDTPPPSKGPAVLLTDQEEGELLSWVAIVMLAADLAGLPSAGGPAQLKVDGNPSAKRYLDGMRGFVSQALDMWKGGMTVQQLIHLQAAVSQGQPPLGVQSVMQQYTRMAVLALEVMTSEQLITRPAAPPLAAAASTRFNFLGQVTNDAESAGDSSGGSKEEEEVEEEETAVLLQPLGYTATFVNGPIACKLPSASLDERDGPVPLSASRRLAVRLLVAFMGAAHSSSYAADKFVESAFMAYSQGWTAGEILSELSDQDFIQSGGLLRIAGEASATGQASSGLKDLGQVGGSPDGSAGLPQSGSGLGDDDRVATTGGVGVNADINRQLFGSWLSCVYMALAQLGAPFPGAQQRPGWAWAGQSSAADAVGLDAFVQGALRRGIEDLLQSTNAPPSTGPSTLAGNTDNRAAVPLVSSPDPTELQPPAVPHPEAAGEYSGASQAVGGELLAAAAARELSSRRALDTAVQSSEVGVAGGEQQADVSGNQLVATFIARLQEDADLAKRLEEERVAAAQEFTRSGKLRGKLVPDALIRMQDDDLENTSSALKLLATQSQLVQRTLALAIRLQQQQPQGV